MNNKISIVIPVRNEAACIATLLETLQPFRQRGHEIVLVDGQSEDATVEMANGLADQILLAEPGRGGQMNVGAYAAQHSILWFLHADSKVPDNSDELILAALSAQKPLWGRFDVRLSGRPLLLRTIGWAMNCRSRCTGIVTGDQGIFIVRRAFEAIGGFSAIPLMEDIEFSKRARKRMGAPACVATHLTTSGRRWESHGVLRTVVRMWALRLAYWAGASPDRLVNYYQ